MTSYRFWFLFIPNEDVVEAWSGELRQSGLSVNPVCTADSLKIRGLELKRNTASFELVRSGKSLEKYDIDASDCTSAAWGVLAKANLQCFARGLLQKLAQSPIAQAELSRAAGAPPSSGSNPGPSASCANDRDCPGDEVCEAGRCVLPGR
jgi:hypothetical protein